MSVGALTWAVESKKLASNVAKEIRRPAGKCATHDEYLAVYARAVPSVQLAMLLCVRTLGLPADVLRLVPRNLVKHAAHFSPSSSRTAGLSHVDEAQLFQCLDAVVQTYLFDDLAVLEAEHGRTGEMHLPTGCGRQ